MIVDKKNQNGAIMFRFIWFLVTGSVKIAFVFVLATFILHNSNQLDSTIKKHQVVLNVEAIKLKEQLNRYLTKQNVTSLNTWVREQLRDTQKY